METFLPDDDTDAEEAEDNNTNNNPDDDTSVFEDQFTKLGGGLSFERNLEGTNGSLCFKSGEKNINSITTKDYNFIGFSKS